MTTLISCEKKFRIYGPFFLSLFLLIFFFAMFIDISVIAFRWTLIPVFYSFLSWESGRWLVMRCRRRMPGINHAKKRIFLIILSGIPVSAAVGFADQLFTVWLGLYKYLSLDDYLFITGLNILCCAVAVSIYESRYYLHEWKILFSESENLKKQNTNTQFQFLREQIKPHFLFNSLNTLSALIITDPIKAELYVEEMSTVYRYLLNKNEKALTTLKEELSFLDSYLLLLRVRFEKSLHVNINTSDQLQERLIPPFVVQLLIENAVKHNIISREHPLTVEIYTDEAGSLHVDNNMQLKSRPDPSENTGLANIRSRYALLNKEEGFKVITENNFFKVTIPLLKINRYPVVIY
jgi:two-component system LytT family sensor kinase